MERPKCPARMDVVRFEDADVARCISCGGVWFDLLGHEEPKRRPGSEAIDTGPAWRAPMHDVQGRVY